MAIDLEINRFALLKSAVAKSRKRSALFCPLQSRRWASALWKLGRAGVPPRPHVAETKGL